MTNLDQFESTFKSADKKPFSCETVSLRKLLLVTDTDRQLATGFRSNVEQLLGSASGISNPQLDLLLGSDFDDVDRLLERVSEHQPDLVCTYRNLHVDIADHPYSLGGYLDVLTQASPIPVLVMPHPKHGHPATPTQSVMAITDHLTGDDHLVSFAAALTATDGTLFLTHVEDLATFDRYIETISKIPEIDTDSARQLLLEQLLREPRDYIASCSEVLTRRGVPFRVESIVSAGHHLADYRRLVDEHHVDLLVLNTKDEDQLAIHGLAYPLAVELRNTPLLLL
ncbi:MAG: hypothetical protein CMJ81_22020 [Planctomycetaceae bacterium]|jgi:nucleotide-binding universal stress UspA family protein|nr:hypothetical protein [Planctomycetaceae bacterium]